MANSSKKRASSKVRSEQFEKNINKRGRVTKTVEKEERSPFGPAIIGFFLFVVVGSSLFQIIRSAQTGGLS